MMSNNNIQKNDDIELSVHGRDNPVNSHGASRGDNFKEFAFRWKYYILAGVAIVGASIGIGAGVGLSSSSKKEEDSNNPIGPDATLSPFPMRTFSPTMQPVTSPKISISIAPLLSGRSVLDDATLQNFTNITANILDDSIIFYSNNTNEIAMSLINEGVNRNLISAQESSDIMNTYNLVHNRMARSPSASERFIETYFNDTFAKNFTTSAVANAIFNMPVDLESCISNISIIRDFLYINVSSNDYILRNFSNNVAIDSLSTSSIPFNAVVSDTINCVNRLTLDNCKISYNIDDLRVTNGPIFSVDNMSFGWVPLMTNIITNCQIDRLAIAMNATTTDLVTIVGSMDMLLQRLQDERVNIINTQTNLKGDCDFNAANLPTNLAECISLKISPLASNTLNYNQIVLNTVNNCSNIPNTEHMQIQQEAFQRCSSESSMRYTNATYHFLNQPIYAVPLPTASPTTMNPVTITPTVPGETFTPTTNPVTNSPVTVNPVTMNPQTDTPSSSPVTNSPVTMNPQTDTPSSSPVTNSPVTMNPQTDTPSLSPVTNSPVTVNPVTMNPQTDTPSLSPVTNSPVTVNPVTMNPQTDTPSLSPVTNSPVTVNPVTMNPQTDTPSSSPVTNSPVTMNPQTDTPSLSPVTNSPVTVNPVTMNPQTDTPSLSPVTITPTVPGETFTPTISPVTMNPQTDTPSASPVTMNPQTDTPSASPVTMNPQTDTPSSSPVTNSPVTMNPQTDTPSSSPVTNSPVTMNPQTDTPSLSPVTNSPVTVNPVTMNPQTDTPSLSPVTNSPVTVNPVTMNPQTDTPSSSPVTNSPVTMNPQTDTPSLSPVTNSPVTVNPVTMNPQTDTPSLSPVTNSPVTVNPVTMNPQTDTPSLSPVTNSPVTVNPVTMNPQTDTPSLSPVTNSPVTVNPVTMNPQTDTPSSSPVTNSPVTMNPQTDTPSLSPVTNSPVTVNPVTMNPQTDTPSSSPVTNSPVTVNPVTMNPQTDTPSLSPVTITPTVPGETFTPTISPVTMNPQTDTPSASPVTMNPQTDTPSASPVTMNPQTDTPSLSPVTLTPTQEPTTINVVPLLNPLPIVGTYNVQNFTNVARSFLKSNIDYYANHTNNVVISLINEDFISSNVRSDILNRYNLEHASEGGARSFIESYFNSTFAENFNPLSLVDSILIGRDIDCNVNSSSVQVVADFITAYQITFVTSISSGAISSGVIFLATSSVTRQIASTIACINEQDILENWNNCIGMNVDSTRTSTQDIRNSILRVINDCQIDRLVTAANGINTNISNIVSNIENKLNTVQNERVNIINTQTNLKGDCEFQVLNSPGNIQEGLQRCANESSIRYENATYHFLNQPLYGVPLPINAARGQNIMNPPHLLEVEENDQSIITSIFTNVKNTVSALVENVRNHFTTKETACDDANAVIKAANVEYLEYENDPQILKDICDGTMPIITNELNEIDCVINPNQFSFCEQQNNELLGNMADSLEL